MTALERYIDDLVSNKEPQDDFPKNESSWEELYDLCGKLIAQIVTLKREAAQQSVEPTASHVDVPIEDANSAHYRFVKK
jgi:hypothetical protein